MLNNFKQFYLFLFFFISLNGSNNSSIAQKAESLVTANNITYNYSPIKYTLIGLNTIIFVCRFGIFSVNHHANAIQFFWIQITYFVLLSLFFSDVIKNKFIKLSIYLVGMIVLPIVISLIVAYCRKTYNSGGEDMQSDYVIFPIILFLINGVGIGLYEGLNSKNKNKVNNEFNKEVYEYNKKIKLGMLTTTLGIIIAYFAYDYFFLGQSHAHEVLPTCTSMIYFITLSLFMSDPYKITLTKLVVYSSFNFIFPMIFVIFGQLSFPCLSYYKDPKNHATICSGKFGIGCDYDKGHTGTTVGIADLNRRKEKGVSNVRFYVEWYGLPILLWIINTVFLILCYKHNKKITTSLHFISPKSPLQNHLLHA